MLASAHTEKPSSESMAAPVSQNRLLGIVYIVAFIMLTLGLGLGYVFSNVFPRYKTIEPVKTSSTTTDEAVIPPDAVEVDSCEDYKGTLFVKPEDIPNGPIYMVYNGKVVGVEFLIGRDDFLAGKYFKFDNFNIKTKFTQVDQVTAKNDQYQTPHFYFDLYAIPESEAKKILCPGHS